MTQSPELEPEVLNPEDLALNTSPEVVPTDGDAAQRGLQKALQAERTKRREAEAVAAQYQEIAPWAEDIRALDSQLAAQYPGTTAAQRREIIRQQAEQTRLESQRRTQQMPEDPNFDEYGRPISPPPLDPAIAARLAKLDTIEQYIVQDRQEKERDRQERTLREQEAALDGQLAALAEQYPYMDAGAVKYAWSQTPGDELDPDELRQLAADNHNQVIARVKAAAEKRRIAQIAAAGQPEVGPGGTPLAPGDKPIDLNSAEAGQHFARRFAALEGRPPDLG